MITISLAGFMLVLAKMASVVLIMLFSAMIILWPINDQPVSKTQKVIYGIVNIIAALFVFGVIQFV